MRHDEGGQKRRDEVDAERSRGGAHRTLNGDRDPLSRRRSDFLLKTVAVGACQATAPDAAVLR